MVTANDWIRNLELVSHPEGGYYKETYRSAIKISKENLPEGYSGSRKLITGIIYLLHSGEVSKLHRLKSDEMWFFHFGSSLRIEMIDKNKIRSTCILGSGISKGEVSQFVIPAGTIFGAEILDKNTYGVYGCVVSPGFEFDDFEMFDKNDLLKEYPEYQHLIKKFL